MLFRNELLQEENMAHREKSGGKSPVELMKPVCAVTT